MAKSLRSIQAWMYGVITHPESVEDGAKFSPPESASGSIDSIVSPSQTLTSTERITIYRNSYFLRLRECFTHEFRGLHSALGDDMFNHFVWTYLQAYPSTSYTLNELGAQFPSFLEQSLEDSLNGGSPDWWQLFVIDVAKYERAYVETYNGEGHEELESVEAIFDVSFIPSPALRLLQLRFSVANCIHAFQNNDFDAIPDPKETNYVLTRKNYRVSVVEMEENEFYLLQKWMDEPELDCPKEYQDRWERLGICYVE